MRYLPNAAQMKEADQYTINELGIPSLDLMENAALSCVSAIEDLALDKRKVCIFCGAGNNGGDGFAIGRILHQKGYDVHVVFVGNREKCTFETSEQIRRYESCGRLTGNEIPNEEYSVIVDAIFGVGLSRNIEGHYKNVIEQMNQMSGIKVAVDIPSGISADNGEILGVAFHADITVTFQAEKIGITLYPGREYVGKIIVADIGISSESFQKDKDVACTFGKTEYKNLLPVRKENSHKGTYGKLLIVAGCKGMSGAAYLNAMSAYTIGAGLVQIYTVEENRIILQTLLPEAIITTYENYSEREIISLLDWADAVCIGSGIGTNQISQKILKKVLEHVEVPCVIDADGLNILSTHKWYLNKKKHGNFIITPHMKEMSRLTGNSIGEIIRDRIMITKKFAEKFDIICILKDARTITASLGMHTHMNFSGNSAMAKAGSGDVLTGVIGGLLAQGLSCMDAAVLGPYLHGKAGDYARKEKGSYSVLARDLIEQLCNVLREEEK